MALSDQQTPNPTVFPPVQIHLGIQIDFITLSASHPMATYFQSWNRSQVQLMMRSFMVCATLWIIWEYFLWTDLLELNRMREDADDSQRGPGGLRDRVSEVPAVCVQLSFLGK